MALDPRLQSPREKPLFVAGAILSGLAWIVLVATIGILAAIAIPNSLKYQLRAKDQAAAAALSSLHEAEVARHGREGAFVELQVPGQVPGSAKMSWTEEERRTAEALGWRIPASGHHAFTVAVGSTEDGRQAYAACAEADLDGDGAFSAWMVWQPVEDEEGDLLAPAAPCRFNPQLARPATFQDGDAPGVPVRVSPEGVC